MTARYGVLVVDDEELARRLLVEHLSADGEIEVLGECANGFEAVKSVAEKRPDILFLDVQMPKLDGFEVLQLLDPPLPAVVFVTAYDQYALKAFEVHAVDYLLKPVSAERFRTALERAKARASERAGEPAAGKRPVPEAELAAAPRPPDRFLPRIAVKDGTRVTVIPAERIDWVRAQDDYVLIRSQGRDHLKQQTLGSLEGQLDPGRFVRVHRSYLLNVERLARLEPGFSGEKVAVLHDGTEIPVSRAGAARLREILT